MMRDYKELVERLHKRIALTYAGSPLQDDLLEAADAIGELLPSAEVEPVKRGKWEITEAYPHNVYCSVCHKRYAQTHWAVWEDGSLPKAYCPNCGAKMKPISASTENGREQRRSPDASL